MNNYEVLDKIKKLLRLGKSPNPHEAELAVSRAFEMAARHQIDIESIRLEDDVRKIVAEKFPCQARLSFARKKILNLLVAFFNVNIVLTTVPRQANVAKPTVTFIGKTVDIQIARYVYDFLHTARAASLRQFCKEFRRKPSRSSQENFIQGWIYGVARTLKKAQSDLSEQQNALIVSEDGRRRQCEESIFDPDKLKLVKSRDPRQNTGAVIAGFVQGQKVSIRKPLESNAAGQLLLS
jgi:hypothetical protein